MVSSKASDIEFGDKNGDKHCLWRITDKAVLQYVSEAMNDKTIFIADGHHRYETALNYRDWLSKTSPEFNSAHPANYVMMYLCSMEDPGLVILPAHRMLNEVPASSRESLIQKVADYFDITTLLQDPLAFRQAIRKMLDYYESKKINEKLYETISRRDHQGA